MTIFQSILSTANHGQLGLLIHKSLVCPFFITMFFLSRSLFFLTGSLLVTNSPPCRNIPALHPLPLFTVTHFSHNISSKRLIIPCFFQSCYCRTVFEYLHPLFPPVPLYPHGGFLVGWLEGRAPRLPGTGNEVVGNWIKILES